METPAIATALYLDPSERQLITLIAAKYAEYTITSIERRSDRSFDLTLHGTYTWVGLTRAAFSAWLPLAAIRDLTDWDCDPIASLSDYPLMAEQGDWSAIRDTNTDTIWQIFDAMIFPLVNPTIDYLAKLKVELGVYCGLVELHDAANPKQSQTFAIDASRCSPKHPHLNNGSIAHFFPTTQTLALRWGIRSDPTTAFVTIR